MDRKMHRYTVTVLTLEALCDESSTAAGQSQAAQVSQLLRLGGVVNTHGLVPLACGAATQTQEDRNGMMFKMVV